MRGYESALWFAAFFVWLGLLLTWFEEIGFWYSAGILVIAVLCLVRSIETAIPGGLIHNWRERRRVPRQYRKRISR